MKIIGHRGAKGLAPENTIAAILKAMEHKADAVELDLRVTKDDIVILHHDKYLKSPAGEKLYISKHNFKKLKQYKSNLTTLTEALNQVGDKIIYVLEVKSFIGSREIIKIINKYLKDKWPSDRFLLASKSQVTLEFLHHELPEIEKVVIERWSGVRAKRRGKKVNSKILFMNHRVIWYGYIKSVRKSGRLLYPYPLNNPKKARRWFKYGIAGLITDYPDLYEID
jgi:glycerophosphoryl diester phosphodiesterase